MTVVAIMRVKDEADVIGASIRRLRDQVDAILVADNGSTDGTAEILEDLARSAPIEVVHDPEVAYYQSRAMSALAALAEEAGASWVLPVDADEVWYSPFGRIADVLADCDGAIAPARLFDHVATGADPNSTDAVQRMGWRRRAAAALPKVACRPRVPVVIEQGNHGAHYATHAVDGLLVVRHYPYRSPAQMIRKARNGAAAYAATDLPEHIGQHWREYGRLSDAEIAAVFREHFWTCDPQHDPTLIFDPCPL